MSLGSMSAAAGDLFAGGGEMGALMRSMDWSKTGLGPVEGWPKSLRTMLGVILGSRFPMLLWWGPDLLHLYNDAYRPILRDKHPASLGGPAEEVWAEVWDVAGPMARSVQAGGPATWTEDLQLFINSAGMLEETYFTFSYSPIPGDDGRVGGVLNTVQETTAKVQSERQIRMLHDLASRTAEASSKDNACRIAAEVLAQNESDLPFALLYTVEEGGREARLIAATDWKGHESRATAARVSLDEDARVSPWPLAQVLRTQREVVVDDLAARFGVLPAGRWGARPVRAIVLPLSRAGHPAPHAFFVAAISPHRALDDRYRRFFRATADQVGHAIVNVTAYEAERKRAEALAEIDRAKTAFFSNVSHEFRTPLTLILGHVDEAVAQPDPALRGESLESVRRSGMRLLRLVNSLLDFARIEADRLQLALVPTDLAALTADLASSFRSLVEQAGLELVVDCPPLPDPVLVDPTQWEKIVLNLISNAFKFTFTGKITVSLRVSGEQVELTVRDTGTGIPSGELPHLFERFHRVEGARGRSFEGTGIGLSLVKELAELHGGSVRATSVEGEGSAFVVSIPVGSAAQQAGRELERVPTSVTPRATPYLLEASRWIDSGYQPSAAPFEASGKARASSDAASRRERARVLVVDDNADMREYLSRLLSTRWQVELAEDGQAAFALARIEPPDLVLSDVMMPRMDGVALLRALREHPPTSHVPVVLLSARAGEEAMLAGLDTGADDYLIKPFAARELLARVQTHLELARQRRTWSRELERANGELEAFSYTVSHDLRDPLCAIEGLSDLLVSRHSSQLDEEGRQHLEHVRDGSQRMLRIIDDLLNLSRIARTSMLRERVDISEVVRQVVAALRGREPARSVECCVSDGLHAQADGRLLRVVFENLLSNAWKFTSKQPAAKIEVGEETKGAEAVYYVRDNGAGFDMEQAKRLFVPFQRLHSEAQFEGAGIGLATVQRVITRHGGRIWAQAAPGDGATFYFTLPEE